MRKAGVKINPENRTREELFTLIRQAVDASLNYVEMVSEKDKEEYKIDNLTVNNIEGTYYAQIYFSDDQPIYTGDANVSAMPTSTEEQEDSDMDSTGTGTKE